ncbi:MAG: hypothetical protein HOM25_08300, partial [Rhodospirillaceae bacterium]|nr:hypothetical protein [Rhodospirillaceae bacterium]
MTRLYIILTAVFFLALAETPTVRAQTSLLAGHPLIDGAAIGDADVVEYWLKRGMRPDIADEDG